LTQVRRGIVLPPREWRLSSGRGPYPGARAALPYASAASDPGRRTTLSGGAVTVCVAMPAPSVALPQARCRTASILNAWMHDPTKYRDFAYLGMTIGMTWQVSDTSLSTKVFRRTVTHHALLSYLFGAVIVALVINTVSSLLG